MSLIIVELSTNFIYIIYFLLKHHRGYVNIWCTFWIIFDFKMKQKSD